jgi:hypothetical protein
MYQLFLLASFLLITPVHAAPTPHGSERSINTSLPTDVYTLPDSKSETFEHYSKERRFLLKTGAALKKTDQTVGYLSKLATML